MANKCPILRRSGLPEGSKKNTAVQEVIRRLKNTSRELGIQDIEPILIEYMSELAMGGYTHTWRMDVLQAGIKGYSRMWASETDGKGWVNRPEHATATKRRAEKLTGASNWFKKTSKTQQEPKRSKHHQKGIQQTKTNVTK